MNNDQYRNLLVLSGGIVAFSVLLLVLLSSSTLHSVAAVLGSAANLLAFIWIAATLRVQAEQLHTQNSALLQQMATTQTEVGLSLYTPVLADLNEIARDLYVLIMNEQTAQNGLKSDEADSYIRIAVGSVEFLENLRKEISLSKTMVIYLCQKYIRKGNLPMPEVHKKIIFPAVNSEIKEHPS